MTGSTQKLYEFHDRWEDLFTVHHETTTRRGDPPKLPPRSCRGENGTKDKRTTNRRGKTREGEDAREKERGVQVSRGKLEPFRREKDGRCVPFIGKELIVSPEEGRNKKRSVWPYKSIDNKQAYFGLDPPTTWARDAKSSPNSIEKDGTAWWLAGSHNGKGVKAAVVVWRGGRWHGN